MFARARDLAWAGERGSGSLLSVAVAAAGAMLTGLAVAASVGFGQYGALRQAADQAALAAADVARGIVPGAACDLGGLVAQRNGAALERCTVSPTDAWVRVSGEVLGLAVAVDSRAGEPR